MTALDHGLFDKVSKKLGSLKRGTLIKRIQRRAQRESISSAAALFLVAKDASVSITGALRKAAPEVRTEVQMAASRVNTDSVVRPQRRATARNASAVTLRLRDDSLRDPLLPPAIVHDAERMSGTVYPLLYIFENSIRNLIQRVLGRDDDKWWDTIMSSSRALSEIRRKVQDRVAQEERFPWHGKRGSHPLYYTDFDDLITILASNAERFRQYFPGDARGVRWLTEKMAEIGPSRNITAHHNPLGRHDFERLKVNVRDWQAHLESITDKLQEAP